MLLYRVAVEEDGEDDRYIGTQTQYSADLDELLLHETQSTMISISWPPFSSKSRVTGNLGQAVVEEQHAGLETPDEGHIAGPSRKQTFGANDKTLDLLWSHGGSLSSSEANVGTMLACPVS